jgi:hypothetical protein
MAQSNFTLKDVSKRSLRTASRQAVRDDLSALHAVFKRRRWLPASNRYVRDTIERLQKDRGTSVKLPDLASYIAVSAPLHCADGWMFVSRALAALACGDASTARHMGYYAELRAAVSILASEGIGVFNHHHYVVPSQGTCAPIPGKPTGAQLKLGTHVFAWITLDHWSDLRRSADLLATVVRPGGQTLGDWLSHFMAGQYRGLASRWLKLWGADLRSFPADREARNQSSYQPTRLVPPKSVGEEERSSFITALWALAEPSEPSRFDGMDRFLLRQSVREIFQGVTGQSWIQNPADFTRHVRTMVEDTAPTGLSEDQWLAFLTGASSPDTPLILAEAASLTGVASPRHHMQVIARATLLLRIASGACMEAFRATGTTTKLLRFWWERFGVDFRLWPEGETPEHLVDLWADVQDALDRNSAWVTSNTPTQIARWTRATADSLVELTACERIALWGMGL